ncbi:MAG: hypothetical protein JRL30_01730 [Deltaproteobacteria bacterium]|nr:hypothetical protein [Deltaproteobacteria bacterium]
MEESLKQDAGYLKAYREFRESVDFSKGGFLPDLDNLVWYLLVGVPPVPADGDLSEEGQITAVDQRLNILKAVFVELNRNMPEEFLDQGLQIYDRAGASVRDMIRLGNGEKG